jgi:ADP-heptose:LPS heptosyltransferase
MHDADRFKSSIRFVYLPVGLRLAIRDLFVFANLLQINFANLLIKPFKYKTEKEIKNKVKNKEIRKVLIIRNDQIGDTILSLKLIEALKQEFSDIYILVSEKNEFIFKEIDMKTIKLQDLSNKDIKFDLTINLTGMPIPSNLNTEYTIGMNKGLSSFSYSTFYKYSISTSKMQVTDFYKELIKDLLGINLKVDDSPPSDFKKEKKNQIFIFVGNKPNRNLPYEKWKELILIIANKYSSYKIIVADDLDLYYTSKLISDPEITRYNNIEILNKKLSLPELKEITNDSKLFIALDGGAEHYLERYTNSIKFFTCEYPSNWKTFSLNRYNIHYLGDDHILEETTTSAGLKKYVLYRVKQRKPCYDLVCDYKKFKEIDFNIIKNIL